jgi:hypothetical protein
MTTKSPECPHSYYLSDRLPSHPLLRQEPDEEDEEEDDGKEKEDDEDDDTDDTTDDGYSE